MKTLKNIFVATLILFFASCSDYLDIVPDDTATLDIVFNNRNTAERYLVNCYHFVPEYGNIWDTPGLSAGHETWYYNTEAGDQHFTNKYAYGIARGIQNVPHPLCNYWDGEEAAKPMFRAIRECNIFLEYVRDMHRVNDLTDAERRRWIAEVNILKTYYHYYLFHLYGPIPIVDKAVPIFTDQDGVKVTRVSIDEIVEYMVGLIDESYEDLPPRIALPAVEAGRLTRAAALSIKAKILLWAASPIFNGNTNYANFRNKEGEYLINQEYSREKWVAAANATLAAIESAESNEHSLYDFTLSTYGRQPDAIIYSMNVRQAVTDRFNPELVWGIGKQSTESLQKHAMPILIPAMDKNKGFVTGHYQDFAKNVYAPTLETAERFYTKNGVPIDEDVEWQSQGYYTNRYKTETVTYADRYNMKIGFNTATLHFRREPRFYGSLGFDGSTWFGNGWTNAEDETTKNYLDAKFGKESGKRWGERCYSVTGYFAKKLIHMENAYSTSSTKIEEYPFPIVRLADLYLMYAEALNEATEGDNIPEEVYTYLRLVRERSGLKQGLFEQTEDIGDVRVAWRVYSNDPDKPNTKAGMREIIHQERQIELALEGQQYHDLRRWKKATAELSKPVQGWNVNGLQVEEYYNVRVLYTPKAFSNKNYLWPVKENDLQIDDKLIQTYGW